MISYIKGQVIEVDEKYATVSVQGLGYKVFLNSSTLSGLSSGDTAEFYTHLAVRENALDLFGFDTSEELGYFELLISISGIGPRSALGILDVAPPKTLRQAILAGETSHLTRVSGIGKKSAEKIILELSNKVPAIEGEETASDELDTIDALTSLGYSQREAREALKDIPDDITETQERIKYALKNLG